MFAGKSFLTLQILAFDLSQPSRTVCLANLQETIKRRREQLDAKSTHKTQKKRLLLNCLRSFIKLSVFQSPRQLQMKIPSRDGWTSNLRLLLLLLLVLTKELYYCILIVKAGYLVSLLFMFFNESFIRIYKREK